MDSSLKVVGPSPNREYGFLNSTFLPVLIRLHIWRDNDRMTEGDVKQGLVILLLFAVEVLKVQVLITIWSIVQLVSIYRIRLSL